MTQERSTTGEGLLDYWFCAKAEIALGGGGQSRRFSAEVFR